MGRKKYYCDFCDRFFNDDKNTRTKHLNSLNHMNKRKEHYNIFRDPESILNEESVKKPCRKFHHEGFCPFGEACTFSHYSRNDLEILKVESLKKKLTEFIVPSFNDWLVEYNEKKNLEREKKELLLWSTVLPPELRCNMSYLPPSVLPFQIQEFMNSEFSKWGE